MSRLKIASVAMEGQLNNKTMLMMIGLPGSGKSTYVKMRFPHSPIVSGDELKTGKAIQDKCEGYLRTGQGFSVDATNVTIARRAPLIELAKKYGYYCVGMWLKTSPKACIENIALRFDNGGPKVSRVAVYKLNKEFEQPHVEEGFTAVFGINIQ